VASRGHCHDHICSSPNGKREKGQQALSISACSSDNGDHMDTGNAPSRPWSLALSNSSRFALTLLKLSHDAGGSVAAL